MDKKEIAQRIFDAFAEGFNSFASPCNPYNSVESAWEESRAREEALRIFPDFVPEW